MPTPQTPRTHQSNSRLNRTTYINRFCDCYGVDGKIFTVGLTLIAMRSHVWGISPGVQNRMRHHWKVFCRLLAEHDVHSIEHMTGAKVRDVVMDLEASMSKESPKEQVRKVRDIVFTVNNVLGCMHLLKWVPIEYQAKGNIFHRWQLPEKPTHSMFHEATHAPQVTWIGKPYAVVNSGASPTLLALGKDAVAHLFKDELSVQWATVYRQGWRVFEYWCPYPSTDPVTTKDVEEFSAYLATRASATDDSKLRPVVAVAALNIVNETLKRLRGSENWNTVPHQLDEATVSQVPRAAQIAIGPVSERLSSTQNNANEQQKLRAPEVREHVRKNYLLATSLRSLGQSIIKLRSQNTPAGYAFNEQRSKSWYLFSDFALSKSIEHASEVTLDLLKAYEAHLAQLVRQTGIKEPEAKTRLMQVMQMLGAVKDMQFVTSDIYENDVWIGDWAPRDVPSEECAEQILNGEEGPEAYFQRQILNGGLGYGLIHPVVLLASTYTAAKDRKFASKCATTFAVYLKDRGLTQLEEVAEADVDAFIAQLEDRVVDGETTDFFAYESVALINTIMPFVLPGWTFRRLNLPEPQKAFSIDPTRTTVDILQQQSVKENGRRAPKFVKKTYPGNR